MDLNLEVDITVKIKIKGEIMVTYLQIDYISNVGLKPWWWICMFCLN